MTELPFEHFLSTPEAMDCFSTEAIVQAMLDFEATLARAQSDVGLIPSGAASSIAAHCKASLLDCDKIVAASSRAGSLAIPLVQQLRAAVATVDKDAARYVHFGATSQDVIDTAVMLATKKSLAMLDSELGRIVFALANLARVHRMTPVLARTLMQAAQVTSFGAKCANWLAPIARSRWALRELKADALRVQLGGAVGTRALLGKNGGEIARLMAERLELTSAPAPWHTQRDRIARMAAELGILAGSLGKVARDVSLMMQSEVAELGQTVDAGRGGSSAMPHKKNPVGAMVAIAASIRAPLRVAAMLSTMSQEHERGLGNWQAELAEWSNLFTTVHGAAHALGDLCSMLTVDDVRMRANVESQRGLVFTEAASQLLANELGKNEADALVQVASRRAVANDSSLAQELRIALAADPMSFGVVDESELAAVFSIDEAASQAAWVIDANLDELAAMRALD
ncbi:MAG: 3-carboxy-cis,cis-muconate cycloisomerase [Burkholderiales bacterium]|nr:MAG: 3-carboxy-cis,cis-muconate cycloisomerase [Burkholderiales bacterium]